MPFASELHDRYRHVVRQQAQSNLCVVDRDAAHDRPRGLRFVGDLQYQRGHVAAGLGIKEIENIAGEDFGGTRG
jgi:hypothetical protein